MYLFHCVDAVHDIHSNFSWRAYFYSFKVFSSVFSPPFFSSLMKERMQRHAILFSLRISHRKRRQFCFGLRNIGKISFLLLWPQEQAEDLVKEA